MPKLIIIRGNSGSGKSTVAGIVRDNAKSDTALINQDYVRRTILRDNSDDHAQTAELINQIVLAILAQGYNVVLEGVLSKNRYSKMLRNLVEAYPSYVYYINVTLKETLKRHQTKPIANQVSENKILGWYIEKDILGVENEKVIGEDSSISQSVKFILINSGL